MRATEVRGINGPYAPTADGIERALEACIYDQELGKTSVNSEIVIVFDDGSERHFSVNMQGFGPESYEAAAIAHELGLEHERIVCGSCAFEDENEELDDLKDQLSHG